MRTGDNRARRCIFIVLWDVVLHATTDGDDRRGPALKLPGSMHGISKWYQLKRNRLSCPGEYVSTDHKRTRRRRKQRRHTSESGKRRWRRFRLTRLEEWDTLKCSIHLVTVLQIGWRTRRWLWSRSRSNVRGIIQSDITIWLVATQPPLQNSQHTGSGVSIFALVGCNRWHSRHTAAARLST
jgi:hypothetical protein